MIKINTKAGASQRISSLKVTDAEMRIKNKKTR